MKILRTKNGNLLNANHVSFICKEIDYCHNQKSISLTAHVTNGNKYCLAEGIVESDADSKLESIFNYLTQQGDQEND